VADHGFVRAVLVEVPRQPRLHAQAKGESRRIHVYAKEAVWRERAPEHVHQRALPVECSDQSLSHCVNEGCLQYERMAGANDTGGGSRAATTLHEERGASCYRTTSPPGIHARARR